MHLAPEFGMTVNEIVRDGFEINEKVEMLLASDSAPAISKSIGLGVIGFSDVFQRLAPDVVVLLGDRFEILAAAQAALFAKIPIAHIHGGELTEGAFDESIRHAITKMSAFHFVAAEAYRKRVIQMGESPERVYCFGAPGLDSLQSIEWIDRKSLEEVLRINLDKPVFLITYHPETLAAHTAVEAMGELLLALEEFEMANIIFTYPNADTGGRALINRIESWKEAHTGRVCAFPSLGQQKYLSLIKQVDVVIGNSSSGLIEAPALKKATVNIGDRQAGRLRATSVIDCPASKSEIVAAIKTALSDECRSKLETTMSLYGIGGVSRQIKEVLKSVTLNPRIDKAAVLGFFLDRSN